MVLIGSNSLDTVRRAHTNGFDGTAALELLAIYVATVTVGIIAIGYLFDLIV